MQSALAVTSVAAIVAPKISPITNIRGLLGGPLNIRNRAAKQPTKNGRDGLSVAIFICPLLKLALTAPIRAFLLAPRLSHQRVEVGGG